MDPQHADAIAAAILDPERLAEQRAAERLAAERREAASLRRRRGMAWGVLAGAAIGGVVAWQSGMTLASTVIAFVVPGALVGLLVSSGWRDA